jgi:hypothetical protein
LLTLAVSKKADKKDDNQGVGINFVDILFALVVGQAFMALNRVGAMPAAGRAHLIFAVTLTITSWIGYHQSTHRYTGAIRFNYHDKAQLIALSKLMLDIVLVTLYWVAVQTTEWGFSGVNQSPSWGWSTGIAASAFSIYVLWDYLSWISDPPPRGKWAPPPPGDRYRGWRGAPSAGHCGDLESAYGYRRDNYRRFPDLAGRVLQSAERHLGEQAAGYKPPGRRRTGPASSDQTRKRSSLITAVGDGVRSGAERFDQSPYDSGRVRVRRIA